MKASSIIVVGASAGGVAALITLAAGLPPTLPTAIMVVLHIGAHRSELAALMNAAGAMPAKEAEQDETIQSGQIYVAPPDQHMIIADGRVSLTRGPRENCARPAIDPLFRSAAEAFGPNAMGVILTGNLNDGTSGLHEIKRRGGATVIQDPAEAAHPDMPASAADHVAIDYRLSLAEIPPLLVRWAADHDAASRARPLQTPRKGPDMTDGETFDRPITVTCPDCGGALRRSEDGTLTKYSCHIGHVYTAEIMAAAQFHYVEKLMRAAERSLNERAELCRQMAERAQAMELQALAANWRSAGDEALDRAYALRDLVERDWIKPDSFAGVQRPILVPDLHG